MWANSLKSMAPKREMAASFIVGHRGQELLVVVGNTKHNAKAFCHWLVRYI